VAAVADDKQNKVLRELMKPIHFIPEMVKLDRVLKRFLNRGEHMFAVVDEYGGLSGVITLEDVLEEILGQEIMDERDQVEDMQELARQRRDELLRDIGMAEDTAGEKDTGQDETE